MTTPASTATDVMLNETRVFPPPSAAVLGMPFWHADSSGAYRALHARSITEPEAYWAEEAARLTWFAPWRSVLKWSAPDARWFDGGTLNACYNCVDRHVERGHGNETAIIWEGEPLDASGTPEVRRITYRDLQRDIARLGTALRQLGVRKGDVVTVYMPMVPELAVAMLACARIGAAHSVIFGGFAPQAISDRMADAKSRVVITADGGYRRGEIVPLLANVRTACADLATRGHKVEHAVVLRRDPIATRGASRPAKAEGLTPAPFTPEHDWLALLAGSSEDCPCEPMQSEDMLFLLYTSGSTGKPKGIVHTTGGYLTFVATTARLAFNLIPDCGQVFWCSADIGWVTGHSYVLYGLLLNRIPTVMYEGAPNFPMLEGGSGDRFWRIIARHGVTHFYTAPTAIRTFMKWGDHLPAGHDLTTLKVLGSVGEPINPEAWMWYHQHIGGGRCPIVDTYWQTETGGHVVTPLPGAVATKPGSCTLPMVGIDAAVVDERGVERPANQGGLFVIRKPWPGMLRGIFGDRDRFVKTYFPSLHATDAGAQNDFYFSADGARRDEDGYFWIQGRVDDVIKVSGHLLGTMEIESALVSHPAVAEAAVVGFPHALKGSGVCAFVTLRANWKTHNPGRTPDDALRKELTSHVRQAMGALAQPDQVRFTDALPKTRSGKIMRRLLRDVAAGVEKITQDTTTLEDFSVVAKLRQEDE